MHERGSNRLDTAAALASRFNEAMKAVEALEAASSGREKELAKEAERAHAVWDASLSKWGAAHATAVAQVDAAVKQVAAEGEPRLHVRSPPSGRACGALCGNVCSNVDTM